MSSRTSPCGFYGDIKNYKNAIGQYWIRFGIIKNAERSNTSCHEVIH